MGEFSVVIATRNRPALFAKALSSVLRQSCEGIEIVVVNDGSDEVHLPEYRTLIEAAGRPVQFHSLVRRPNGHGQSYAINFGVAQATSDYICFLDDDDRWTDDGYLDRIAAEVAGRDPQPDLLFSNQAAFVGERRKEGPIWLEGLAASLERAGRRPVGNGFYVVSVQDLVDAGGFCHLNTMIVRRALYEAVGGMDESIRWECDHDLFLRLIDKAGDMLLSPSVVSRHNIPDPAKAASMTTSLTEVQRRLFQLRVFEKASLFSAHSEIRAHGWRYKGYTLKRIAEALAVCGHYRTAACYAREALGAAPTVNWAAYTLYTSVKMRSACREAISRFQTRKTLEKKNQLGHTRDLGDFDPPQDSAFSKRKVVGLVIGQTKKILSGRQISEPEPIGGSGPRGFVGGMWHEMGELQFRFLVDQGLQPHHVLIDVACGSLRAGVRLIPYLEAGNYLGIDIDASLIAHGKAKEVGSVLCAIKRPEFVVSDHFEFENFSKKCDFAIAQSLFTHLISEEISLCLRKLRPIMNDDGRFFATFFEVPKPVKNPPRSHPHGAYRFTVNEMRDLGAAAGWGFEYIGDWRHPRGQRMVCYMTR
jgi:glycosyltransferase involved in cell wall biosynthesis